MAKENRRTKSKKRLQQEVVKQYEVGDLIPMDDARREFLKVHGKFVDNPEMEAIMAYEEQNEKRRHSRMKFNLEPLARMEPLTNQEAIHLKAAQDKQFICRNRDCSSFGKPAKASYRLRKYIRNLKTSPEDRRRFGQRREVIVHCAAVCKKCGAKIKFVKCNKANRRAAEDMSLSGPHQIVKSI